MNPSKEESTIRLKYIFRVVVVNIAVAAISVTAVGMVVATNSSYQQLLAAITTSGVFLT